MEFSVPSRSVGISPTFAKLPKPTVRVSLRTLLPQIHPPRSSICRFSSHKMGPHSQKPILCSSSVQNSGSPAIASPSTISSLGRVGEVKRVTKETDVAVRINLDGTGVADSSTGIPFLNHMLDQLASHGLFDVHVRATGDIHIDDHHTNEDVALAIGTALLQALGDRKGINRFGDFSAPLDEALVHVALACSRSFCTFKCPSFLQDSFFRI